MGVTITKSKPASAAALHQDEPEAEAQQIVAAARVQEFLDLDKELTKHAEKIAAKAKRHGELKKQFLAAVEESKVSPDDKVELRGTDPKSKIVEISPQSNKTVVTDMEAAKKALGTELFMKIAKVTLSDLKDYLTKPQFESVTVTSRDGGRRLTITD